MRSGAFGVSLVTSLNSAAAAACDKFLELAGSWGNLFHMYAASEAHVALE